MMIEQNINWAIKTDDNGTTLRRTDENGTVWWVPEAPGNRHYEEYVRYTAWVEAGNSPEDFWAAERDTVETLDG